LQECESGGENDPRNHDKGLSPLRKLSRLTNWAIILPHHNNRGRDEYAGTAAIAGSTDALWSIPGKMTASPPCGFDTGWILPTITVKEKRRWMTRGQTELACRLHRNPPCRQRHLHLTGWKKSTAYTRSAKDKNVRRSKTGRGKRYYWRGVRILQPFQGHWKGQKAAIATCWTSPLVIRSSFQPLWQIPDQGVLREPD